jgi:SAM-dependent methyltransferase
VIEAGSLNINGSVREFFDDPQEYVGVDAKNGRDVDWHGIFHEYDGHPKNHFDVAISTETLEHDPFWTVTLRTMIDFIKPEGALVVSCAGPNRGPHGTKYHLTEQGKEVYEYHPLGPERDYYFNMRPQMLLYELFCTSGFRYLSYDSLRDGADICFVAVGKYRQQINYSRGEIANLRKRGKTKI